MIEVEIKLKIKDVNAVTNKLTAIGFVHKKTVKEIDKYYDNANGDVKNSDSALRIRRVTDLDTNKSICQINYKGKKMDTVSMSRQEYETEVIDAEAMNQILESLGYIAVRPFVIKVRNEYSFNDTNACVDIVEGLGEYLELEVMVETEEQKPDALKSIDTILNKLGYNIEETTNVSYLSQLIMKGTR